MAAFLTDHQEIKVVQTISGNTPKTLALPEASGQTYLAGVPVMSNAGFINEWNATVGAASSTVGIAGITRQVGSNYGSNAAGAPLGAFSSVGAPGTTTTFGKVPFEASAVNIPRGAPLADGRVIVEVAADDTIFEAQWDDAAAGTQAPPNTVLFKQFGLTKDTTGHWYVDNNKSTQGTNTVVIIVAINPADMTSTGAGINNARVWFKFIKSIQQFQN